MTAKHNMKINGMWYKTGSNIPDLPQSAISAESYTKTDINRMTTAELQMLAKKQGIQAADEKTGAELKKLLIEHFGL